MKRFLLTLMIVLTIPILTSSQNLSIEETIDYINDKLEKYDFLTKNEFIKNNSYSKKRYHQFSLSKKGKLTITQYLNDGNKVKEEAFSEVYLKQLNLQVKLDVEADLGSIDAYSITLSCQDNENCIFFATINKYSYGYILYVYNADIALSLKRAIEHLIKQAQNNAEFYERDPFGFN